MLANVTNPRRAVRELRDAGFLAVKSSRGISNQYALTIPDAQPLGRITVVQGGQIGHTTPDNCDTPPRTNRSPKQGKEQGNEQGGSDRPVNSASGEPSHGTLKDLFHMGEQVLDLGSGGLVCKLQTRVGLAEAHAVLAKAGELKTIADRKAYVASAIKNGTERLLADLKFNELAEAVKDVAPIEAPGDARRAFIRACEAADGLEDRERIADEIIAGARRDVARDWPKERGQPVDLKWWIRGERWKATRPAAVRTCKIEPVEGEDVLIP